MALPSMENHHLLWYFEKYLSFNGSMELVIESQHHLPWNRETCLFVLTYVVQFCSNLELCEFTSEIMALDEIATSVHESYIKLQEDNEEKKTLSPEDYIVVDEINKKRQEFSEMLVNSFVPDVVPRFFNVPKLHQLPDKDKKLKQNEILAGFIDFLLRVLYHEANIREDKVQRWSLLRKELSFLLAVLGDTPFQFSHLELAEEVESHLVEFEILANEAGMLVYDCVFHIVLVETSGFGERGNALLEKVELLNTRIKEHCFKFAVLPLAVISRPCVVDSFFIIHSLIVDIEDLMYCRLNISHDDSIKEHIETLHGDLTLLQTFINVPQVPNEQKEALIQIRDLAYEVEYLISSHVAGNMHVWYLNIRLPSLVQKIKLARVGLQQISAMNDFDNYFVDFNSDITQRILEDLIGKGLNTLVISIHGIPGIGKTTMATKLYNCREASDHFDLRAWCVLSEMHGVRHLLIQLLMGLESNPDKSTISKKNVNELREDIEEILSGKRYLIVIDDAGDSKLLSELQCFPGNENGGRILLITQNEDIVPRGSILHKVPLLSDDQCWDLLEKRVFPNDQCPPQLISIGKRIAKRCSGIPQVVVDTARRLVTLEKETSVWETVEEQLDTLLLDGQSNCGKELELSYKRLPHFMKPCFLYLATFPKGVEISKQQLKWMWIAQGYIQEDEEKNQEETAEMYLSDMINRSLVLSGKRGKAFRIDDELHEFIIRKANEENFQMSTSSFSMYEKNQHLCVPSASGGISWRPFGHHCRSLRLCPTDQSSSFQTMPLLKVMDLSRNNYSSLLYPHFDLPLQLKYLSVSDLPKGMVDNLVDLESLHVRSNKRVLIPSVILKRPKLRHVIIKPSGEFEEDCSISETSNLKSLSFVCIYRQEEVEILRHLLHLQKLKFVCGGDVILPSMSFLTGLESLRICFEFGSTNQVRDLHFPSAVKKLCLSGAVLTRKDMRMIGRLKNLQVLKLEKHSIVGDVWEVENSGHFEKLRVLKIESRDLRVWSCGRYSFPELECLVVTGCTKLENIPRDIVEGQSSSPLERFEVMKCGLAAYLSAFSILDKFDYYGNHKVHVVMDKTLEQLAWQDIQLHDDQEALTDPSFMKNLLHYMKQQLGESSERMPAGSLLQRVPWNQDTCTFVFYYVLQFFSNLDHHEFRHVVMALDYIARLFIEAPHYYGCHRSLVQKRRRELFSELFVNSFIPEVKKFFKVLKQHQLSDKDKHLKPTEILAAFLDFLIHVLHRQENISSGEEKLHALIQNQLSFLLGVLGDVPFQPIHPGFKDQVINLLEEFEMLANELGSFIHSCVFPICPLDAAWLHAETANLLVKAESLNAKIKHHCIMFSELPRSVISRPAVVDSLFIIDSLIEDIENLEKCETSFTDGHGTKNQIGVLKDELIKTSKSVNKIADQIPRGSGVNESKEALSQVRDLAYQAEYLINSHVIGNIPAWYLHLRLPSIVQQIKIVNTGLQRLTKEIQASNVMTKSSDGEESSRTLGKALIMHDNDFLSFNEDIENKILEDLFKSSMRSRQIILLSGMPGLGKTTKAAQLYNRQEVSAHFDLRVWCVVSQAYSLRSLFVQILRDIAPNDKTDLTEKGTAELSGNIHKKLFRKRYLIVLDDVWDSGVLDELLLYLPDDQMGSRVIVTSRVNGVAPDNSIFHTLSLISDEQCWELLKKKVYPKQSCPSQLDGVGQQIAKKCGGIPLAVVTTAGILANLEKEETSVWEKLAEQLDELLLDDKNGCRKILELSYEHLPQSIKPCFLYFAAFPEDAEISKKELTRFWIAQGFIRKAEIAEMYLVDLINRSLVLPAKRGWDGGIRTCRIHDLLRDICVAKANEDNFIKSSTNDFSMYVEHQHLCLPSALSIYRRHFGFHFRSFRGCPTDQLSCFQTMPLLKVMDLSPNEYSSLLEPRFDLPVQLRLLGVDDLQGRMVDNLVNLEFIHVRSKKKVVVPSVVLRMVKLKHLLIRKEAVFEEDCSNITETTNLRSLSYVWIKTKEDEDILRHSPHLRKLKCRIGGETILFPDLTALAELESLRIDYGSYFSSEILLSEASFPSTIKKLCLSQSKLPWEKMSIVGQLPKLEVLKLENDAFVGGIWETNDDEFLELRYLKIYLFWDPIQWMSESGHFPSLEKLVVKNCTKIEEIPSDLGYIQSLHTIDMRDCGQMLTSSAYRIRNEQRENGNTQLQVISDEWLRKIYE